MSRNVPDDMKNLVFTEEELAAVTTPTGARKKQHRKPFTPFPKVWQFQLVKIPNATACTYRVALCLLWEAWRSGSNKVKLTNVTLKKEGVGRWGKRRSLEQLGQRWLIAVDSKPRKSPIVTLKHID